jgi:hypothetical protein
MHIRNGEAKWQILSCGLDRRVSDLLVTGTSGVCGAVCGRRLTVWRFRADRHDTWPVLYRTDQLSKPDLTADKA